eukprot:9090289-Pyramimonas_sp.AAC.1
MLNILPNGLNRPTRLKFSRVSPSIRGCPSLSRGPVNHLYPLRPLFLPTPPQMVMSFGPGNSFLGWKPK